MSLPIKPRVFRRKRKPQTLFHVWITVDSRRKVNYRISDDLPPEAYLAVMLHASWLLAEETAQYEVALHISAVELLHKNLIKSKIKKCKLPNLSAPVPTPSALPAFPALPESPATDFQNQSVKTVKT